MQPGTVYIDQTETQRRTNPGQIRFPQADSLDNRTTPKIVIAPEIRTANLRFLFIPNTYPDFRAGLT